MTGELVTFDQILLKREAERKAFTEMATIKQAETFEKIVGEDKIQLMDSFITSCIVKRCVSVVRPYCVGGVSRTLWGENSLVIIVSENLRIITKQQLSRIAYLKPETISI